MKGNVLRFTAAAFWILGASALAGATVEGAPVHGPAAEAFVGVWSGSLKLMGAELPFALTLNLEAGVLSGSMEAQGMKGLEITELSVAGGVLRFRREGPAGALDFEGRRQGDAIEGSLSQGAARGTFSLHRSGSAGHPPPDAATEAGEGPSAATRAATGRWTGLGPCRPPGLATDALCGRHAVREDRQGENGRTIELNVLVLPAQGEPVDPVPLLMLAGGPGGAATQMAPALGIRFPALRERFDILLVDQRGTGASHPLQCTFRDVNEMARAVLQVDFAPAALAACRKALDADLAQYHTIAAVDDLVETAAVLGHAEANVYGMSYGTRAALVLARRHPDFVRSLVLQGVAPLTLLVPSNVARDAQAALDGVFTDCAANPECGAAYPGLQGHLTAVLDRLDAAPVSVPVDDPVTGAPGTLEVSRDVFTGGLRTLLYANTFIQAIPRIVHAAGAGNYVPFAQAVLPLIQLFGRTLHFGLYLSVACSEDIPFIDGEKARESARGTFLGDRMVRHHQAACRSWPRGEIPGGFHEPVRSPVPALLISGSSDPVTPPRWAEAAGRTLPNSLHLVVPRAAHADAVGPCEQNIVAAFLTAGNREGLDVACVAEGRERRYILPDE